MKPGLDSWDEADLEARLGRALQTAGKVVGSFAAGGYSDARSPEYSFGPDKPVAETAMLLAAASAAAHRPAIAARIDALARQLAPFARSRRAAVDVALHPALAFKFALPHVLLDRLGYPDAGFDALLRTCVVAAVRDGHDRPPSAAAERAWLSGLWPAGNAVPGRWSRPPDLRHSVLGSPIDILGGLRSDAYAFTHLLMYTTDFGARAVRLPRRAAVVLGEAESLLARYVDAEDYDLAGEILLAWPYLGAPWSAAAAFTFRLLAGLEDRAGMLPCGNLSGERMAELSGDDLARYALGMSYHTAYVMGFVCAAALRPGRAPPLAIEAGRASTALVARLIEHFGSDQGHWQPLAAALPEPERRALAPFMLDLALAQAFRRREYERVAALLALAAEHDLPVSPMCAQAAELLERIAACAAFAETLPDG